MAYFKEQITEIGTATGTLGDYADALAATSDPQKRLKQDTENYNTVTGIEVVVTVIAKPEIDLGNYIETKDEVTGETYIENISQNTTIGKIQEEIGSNKTVEIYKGVEKVENT